MNNFEAKKMPDTDTLKAYYNQIKKTSLLSFEEELELSEKIEAGDSDAKNRLIEANLRLVIKIAKVYKAPGVALLDLIQEGNLGLMIAAEKYDYRKKVRFSTYASWWIKQSIVRGLSNKRRAIRLPFRKEAMLRKINKVKNSLFQKLSREPDVSEIASAAEMNEKDVEKVLQVPHNMVSLDGTNGDNNGSIADTVGDYSYDPNRELMKKSLEADTKKLLDKLAQTEKKVLYYRYSFKGGKKHTLKSIANELGISPETVRQIEIRALRKLKDSAEDLKEYCFN